jgi:enoyl-CoA hydratase
MHTTVHYRREGGIGWIELAPSPADKPVALDQDSLRALGEAVDTAASDAAAARAVILRSNTERSFVVGANLRALQTLTAETIGAWVALGHAVFDRLADLPMPTIAAVRGPALGGGLELALACDLIVADRSARFAAPEATLGFVPGWGGSHRLPARVGAARAKQMLFTGAAIDAGEAYRIGLVDLLADEDAVGEAAGLARRIEALAADAVARCKALVRDDRPGDREGARRREQERSVECMRDPETQRRLEAFFASRRPRQQ